MKITSYLIILISILTFLFLVGCGNNPKNKEKIENKQADTELDQIQISLLNLHNIERKNRKIEILELDKRLCEYAQNHTKYMLYKNKLEHSNIKNVNANLVAENIAYGQETCEIVTKAWIESYGHRINMLNSKYKKVGFGYINKDGKIYWCAVFTN